MKNNTPMLISFRNIVIITLIFTVISKVQGDRAVFFDKANFQGNIFTLSVNGGCYNFKTKWTGKISSVQVGPDSCMIAWNKENCTGRSMKLVPNSRETMNLRINGFDKQIKSISLCTEISFRPRVDDVGLRIWNPTRQQLNRAKNGNGNTDYPETLEGTSQNVELNFYDGPNFTGRIFTLTTKGGCYNFKSKWANQISSLDSAGHCIKIWSDRDCSGDSATLHESGALDKSRNLDLIGFHKRMQSVRLCSAPFHVEKDGESSEDSEGNQHNKKDPQRSISDDSPLDESLTKTDEDVREIALSEHNKLRRLHGAPELKWDTKIQQIAQTHADWLAKNNKFEHSKNNDLGENLAGISTSDKIDALKEAIRLWYDEIKNYDFENPSFSVVGIKAGHFTQLVWKSTTHIGLGIAWNRRRQWYVVVGNYSPPGNYKGDYEKNVFPPIQKEK